jgi:predicted transcriptional regulator
MPDRRRRDLIIVQILETCRDGASKTKIVYSCNMNFNTANSYLVTLIKSDLIEKADVKPIVYKTTKKGIETLEKLRELQDIISESEG